MFVAVLFTIAKRWKYPRVLQLMKGLTKFGIYIQWNMIQPAKIRKLTHAETCAP